LLAHRGEWRFCHTISLSNEGAPDRKIEAEEHWMRYGVTARRKRNAAAKVAGPTIWFRDWRWAGNACALLRQVGKCVQFQCKQRADASNSRLELSLRSKQDANDPFHPSSVRR
jgi:hypothetical protein